jgi:Tripartite ATP-independent periplasmic transporter, DctM component
MFIDAIPAIIILGTVLFPVTEAVGMHPIHFAIIGVIARAFGLVTPPYGLCLLDRLRDRRDPGRPRAEGRRDHPPPHARPPPRDPAPRPDPRAPPPDHAQVRGVTPTMLGYRRTEFARRLSLQDNAIRRLLDLDHRLHIDQVDRARTALGRRLEVRVLE